MNTMQMLDSDDINLFLPDFCHVHVVFLAVILTELLAFVLVLAPLGQANYNWHYLSTQLTLDLAFVSLFMQWITLVSLSLLCFIRPWLLNHCHSNLQSGMLCYLLILIVTIVVSEIAIWINHYAQAFHNDDIYLIRIPMLQSFLVLAIGLGLFVLPAYWLLPRNKTIIFLLYAMLLIVCFLLLEVASVFRVIPEVQQEAIQHNLFVVRNLGISAIVSAIALRYFYVQHRWRQETLTNAYARAQALQSRIRPHFLFNSMNVIASLIRFNPAKAEQAVEDFAELFRASLADARELVPLQQELELCQQYLRIEALRLGERLKVAWHIEDVPKNAMVPRLTLQPLLENAIYHGIQPAPEGGIIHVYGIFDGKYINLDVENPVPQSTFKHKGNRVAQDNIRQRLQTYYGLEAKLSIYKTADTYHVSLRFPYQKQSDEDFNR